MIEWNQGVPDKSLKTSETNIRQNCAKEEVSDLSENEVGYLKRT